MEALLTGAIIWAELTLFIFLPFAVWCKISNL